jgi:hypothetical protein
VTRIIKWLMLTWNLTVSIKKLDKNDRYDKIFEKSYTSYEQVKALLTLTNIRFELIIDWLLLFNNKAIF